MVVSWFGLALVSNVGVLVKTDGLMNTGKELQILIHDVISFGKYVIGIL